MKDIATWSRKEEWHKHGKNFLVVVKHSTETLSSFYKYEGLNRWFVYAYIYPKHFLFHEFKGSEIYQPATAKLPLHAGASYLRWHIGDDGKPTSVQIGADYNHYQDDEFTHQSTPEEAYEVFNDAEKLFKYLSAEVV